MREASNWSLHFHVSADSVEGGRKWEDAVRFGFLAGGYAPVPQRAFRQMQIGDQIWVRLTWKGGAPPGYVARAVVIREPGPVQNAHIVVDGKDVPFIEARKRMAGVYPANRQEMDGADPEDTWQRAALSQSETDEWVVAVRWEGVIPIADRITHERIPSPGPQTGYPTRPDHVRLLEQAIPRNVAQDDHVDWRDNDFDVTPSDGADGNGPTDPDQDRNELAEDTAMWLAAVYYDRRGWKVQPVDHIDSLGYDLIAQRGNKRRHIEVKGTTGSLAAPHLELSQMRCAESDPDWRLVVVTRALDAPEAIELTGPEVVACEPDPVRWRVQCTGSGTALISGPAGH